MDQLHRLLFAALPAGACRDPREFHHGDEVFDRSSPLCMRLSWERRTMLRQEFHPSELCQVRSVVCCLSFCWVCLSCLCCSVRLSLLFQLCRLPEFRKRCPLSFRRATPQQPSQVRRCPRGSFLRGWQGSSSRCSPSPALLHPLVASA